MLELKKIFSGYGNDLVLQGLSLAVRRGEIVGLLGRNGMGKTTTLKSILRLNDLHAGTITLDGQEISRLAPFQIARLGVVYATQEAKVFTDLSVRENLLLVGRKTTGDTSEFQMIFSKLEERLAQKAGTLSGGEQQMLALARVFLANPQYALLDEPMEGLMTALLPAVAALVAELKSQNAGVLLAEQSPQRALKLCDRILILDKGRIVAEHQAAAVSLSELQRALTL
ncbi:ATP-binding cassette domain-containing protein [Candidatus Acetothermia bacterium]|jgi:branched-chain amino acid transport system ATP-binding protein|nr:ATP-binding cassette domain-containing protein [Candidatus Acetothermia bacterium]MCI2432339.1 ATP-binding cassette domain-containing protein [Candidatus Acetothermia bacterium]MCI2437328.1 ATP-binding cassette domain-containing protein [Candidatus Acetothermia bacterium]